MALPAAEKKQNAKKKLLTGKAKKNKKSGFAEYKKASRKQGKRLTPLIFEN